jgi:prevent-host-death family protein
MNAIINVKKLRASLPEVMKRVRQGGRFTVIYRSRPAFQIIPVNDTGSLMAPLEKDTLYRAKPVGRSMDGRSAANHDALIFS